MKRPLAAVGISVLLTLAVFCFLPAGSTSFALFLLIYALGFVFWRRKVFRFRAYMRLCLSAAVAAAVLFIAVDANQQKQVSLTAGKEFEAVFLITDRTKYDDVYYYNALIKSLDDEKTSSLSLRFYDDALYDVGAIYSAAVRINAEKEARFGQTVQMSGSLFTTAHKQRATWRYFVYRFGEDVRANIANFLGGSEGALIGSMLTGDRSNLPAEARLDLERSGMSHILAVSGLHVSIMLGMIGNLLKRTHCAGAARFVIVTLLSLLLVLLYGGSASIIRAVTMNWLVLCAAALKRQSDSLTSLSAAALVILIPNPKTAGELGFMLSFVSCFALCAVAPLVSGGIEKCFGKRLGALGRSAVSCTTVSLVTFPVLVLYGLPVSLVAPLANFLLLCLVGPMLFLGLLVGLLGKIGFLAPLLRLAALGAGLLAKLLLAGAKLFGSFAFASLRLNDGFVRLWLLGALLVVVIILIRNERVRPALVGFFLVLALLVGIVSKALIVADKQRIYLYENSAVICVCQQRSAMILRESPSDTEVEELLFWCDTMFIPEPEYVIILSGGNADIDRFGPQAENGGDRISFGGMTVGVEEQNAVRIEAGGTLFYARFRPDWTLDLVDRTGESALEVSRGLSSIQDTSPSGYTVYIDTSGKYRTVREA